MSQKITYCYDDLFHQDNIVTAYKRCIRGKTKFKRDAMIFDRDITYNINTLLDELMSFNYTPQNYYSFTVYEPKERVIYASTFRDKLVQNILYNVLKEKYKSVFIFDSYACIEGKGTHRASQRIQHYLRKVKWTHGQECYIIKADVSKFFYSVNRQILKLIIRKHVFCSDLLWLIDTIIDNCPDDKGLPLGNITSHLFANVYLNPLDQFCKRFLSLKFYVRYMDDICIIVENKEKASFVLSKIIDFLELKLDLEINPVKTAIFPINQGVNMVGFKTHPTHKLLRNDSKKKIKRKCQKFPNLIREGKLSVRKAEQIMNSWYGHSQQACSANFVKSLLKKNNYLSCTRRVFKVNVKREVVES